LLQQAYLNVFPEEKGILGADITIYAMKQIKNGATRIYIETLCGKLEI
jgi:hypothetical protein